MYSKEDARAIWLGRCPKCGVMYTDHDLPPVTDEQLEDIITKILYDAQPNGCDEAYLSAEAFKRALGVVHP